MLYSRSKFRTHQKPIFFLNSASDFQDIDFSLNGWVSASFQTNVRHLRDINDANRQ